MFCCCFLEEFSLIGAKRRGGLTHASRKDPCSGNQHIVSTEPNKKEGSPYQLRWDYPLFLSYKNKENEVDIIDDESILFFVK